MTITARAPILAICTAALTLIGCGGGGGGAASPRSSPPVNTSSPPPPAPPPAMFAAVADGNYADVLVNCATADTDSESCALTTLPLLGQEFASPTVDDVMDRTVISHAWMGLRFRQALQSMTPEIFSLMKGATAFVITWDTRPSHYAWRSGAIFIDPAYLWLTNAEKATISKHADFRSGFGSDLSFVSLFRYVVGTSYAWEYFSLDGDETRSITDIRGSFAALLFHELAHSSDAFPPAEISRIDATMSHVEAFRSLADRRISAQLAAQYPLNSQLWQDLAEVLYLGATATSSQRALTATQVGLELENDGANDDYAYSDSWEDLAMLVEEVMMRHHFGIDREIAYTNMVTGDNAMYCDYYIVSWGVRNRISDPVVRARAEFGLQRLLDRADVSEYLDGIPGQWHMHTGHNWCAIQSRSGSTEKPTGANTLAAASAWQSKTLMRIDDLSRHYR